jgi:hypothetical protein
MGQNDLTLKEEPVKQGKSKGSKTPQGGKFKQGIESALGGSFNDGPDM